MEPMSARRSEWTCLFGVLVAAAFLSGPGFLSGSGFLISQESGSDGDPERGGDHDGHDHDGGAKVGEARHDTDGVDAPEVAHRAEERAIWKGFVRHLYATGQEELLPEPLRHRDGSAGDGSAGDGSRALLDFDASDPIKGVLFRASGALIDIDAAFSRARGEPLGAEELPQARRWATQLEESTDPYLKPYGMYFGAQLDLQAEDYDAAMARLQLLEASSRFLPRGDVRRLVVACYIGRGQETLAILDLQYYLSTLAPERQSERAWGLGQLEELRKEHPGPLRESGKRMRSISELLAQKRIGEKTRDEQENVELVLEKIVDLLEAPRCGSCGELKCADCGRKTCDCDGVSQPCKGASKCKPASGSGQGAGSGKGSGSGSGLARGKGRGRNGDPKGDKPSDGAGRKSTVEAGDAGEADLRDASPEERAAWGRINDREVARSLRELWGKIPRSYRLMVTQYYRDLSEIETPPAAADD